MPRTVADWQEELQEYLTTAAAENPQLAGITWTVNVYGATIEVVGRRGKHQASNEVTRTQLEGERGSVAQIVSRRARAIRASLAKLEAGDPPPPPDPAAVVKGTPLEPEELKLGTELWAAVLRRRLADAYKTDDQWPLEWEVSVEPNLPEIMVVLLKARYGSMQRIDTRRLAAPQPTDEKVQQIAETALRLIAQAAEEDGGAGYRVDRADRVAWNSAEARDPL